MKSDAIDKFQTKSYTFRCPFLRNNSCHNIMNGFKETDLRARDLFVAITEVGEWGETKTAKQD